MSELIEYLSIRSAYDKATRRPGQRHRVPRSEIAAMLTKSTMLRDKFHGLGFAPLTMHDEPCACGAEDCPGELGHFVGPNVLAFNLIVLDLDKYRDGRQLDQAGAERAMARLRALKLWHCVYSTFSHRMPDHASLRGVLEPSRPVLREEWGLFFPALSTLLDIDYDTACSKTVGRLWFLPSHPPGGEPIAYSVDGAAVDVALIMELARAAQAAIPPKESTSRSTFYTRRGDAFEIRELIATEYPGAKSKSGGGDIAEKVHIGGECCPWTAEHTSPNGLTDTTILIMTSGAWDFKCQHSHCEHRGRVEFRKHHQPDWAPFDPSRPPQRSPSDPIPEEEHPHAPVNGHAVPLAELAERLKGRERPSDEPRPPDADDEESAAVRAKQMGAAEHRSTQPTTAEQPAQNGAVRPRTERGGEMEIDIKRGPQPAAGNGADPFAEEIRRALADVKAALGRDQLRQRRPLFEADAALLLTEEFPSTQWQVTGLITRGATAMIGGLPKAAKKTWLGTEIAVAIATGTPVCGEFFAERGSVRYFYAEDTRRQVRNRIRALLAGAGRNMPVGRLLLQPRGEFLDILRDEDLAWVVASCRRGDKPDLLVLDPLRDIHSGEEDKSDSMREVMRRLRLLGELLGCTVLAVHHHGKPSETTAKRGGGQRMRGSGSIHGSTDAGIHFMECDGDGVSVFTNTVESEIKGARSAGRFTLELRIDDDEAGEAVCARWTTKREERDPKPSKKAAAAAAKAKQDAADDDRAFAFVRTLALRGERLARRKLRDYDEAPLPDRRMRDALDRLIDVGRLVLEGPIVQIPQPEQHHAS